MGVWIDHVEKTPTYGIDEDSSAALPNKPLYLMAASNGVGGLQAGLAGRLAEVAIWNMLLGQAAIDQLYGNGPLGDASTALLATSVELANLRHYWRVLGAIDPEPATVGSIDLDVVDVSPQVPHPIALSPGSGPRTGFIVGVF